MKFYVNQGTRMVRTLEDGEEPSFKLWQPHEGGWAHISEKAFDEFRAKTLKKFTPAQLKDIRAGKPWIWLGDEPDPDGGKQNVWLFSPPDQIGYLGPVSKTKAKALKWAKEHGYIVINL